MMIVLPTDEPVLEHVHSYYVDVSRMLEHFQGEIGCGGVLFDAHLEAGVIFFDPHDLLGGAFRGRSHEICGQEAVAHLIHHAGRSNFRISVFRLPADTVDYWSGIPAAEKITTGLNTEFTRLESLIGTLEAERLTGYVAAVASHRHEEAMLCFMNGQIVGGSYPWNGGKFGGAGEGPARFIAWCRRERAVCDVGRVRAAALRAESRLPAAGATQGVILGMLEELLGMAEGLLTARRSGLDFIRLLKTKFMAKADRYEFLDPFSGEFDLCDQKIAFTGRAAPQELVTSVTESVRELAFEHGIGNAFEREFEDWARKNERQLKPLGIDLAP